jgi:hypothetical protein
MTAALACPAVPNIKPNAATAAKEVARFCKIIKTLRKQDFRLCSSMIARNKHERRKPYGALILLQRVSKNTKAVVLELNTRSRTNWVVCDVF